MQSWMRKKWNDNGNLLLVNTLISTGDGKGFHRKILVMKNIRAFIAVTFCYHPRFRLFSRKRKKKKEKQILATFYFLHHIISSIIEMNKLPDYNAYHKGVSILSWSVTTKSCASSNSFHTSRCPAIELHSLKISSMLLYFSIICFLRCNTEAAIA